jgi:regulator of protease activity HflC (stomatin/prohibitin superfamily)
MRAILKHSSVLDDLLFKEYNMATVVFSILFFLVGLGFILSNGKVPQQAVSKRWIAPIGSVSIILSILLLVFGSFVVIPAGEVGVKTFLGNVEPDALQGGFHVINPIMSIETMNVRTQNYTMSSRTNEGTVQGNDAVAITMKDQSTPQMDLSVTFHLSPTDAPKVYRLIGTDYVEKIIRPDIRSVIPRVATLFNSTDLYVNADRTLFENICKQQLDSIFRLRGVVLEDVKLREVVPSAEVQTAINAKIASQQEAIAMEYKKQKATAEAEILKIQARGIDSAQAIIGHSLTSSYLQYKYLETIKDVGEKGNSMIFSPFDQHLSPLLNLGKGH